MYFLLGAIIPYALLSTMPNKLLHHLPEPLEIVLWQEFERLYFVIV